MHSEADLMVECSALAIIRGPEKYPPPSPRHTLPTQIIVQNHCKAWRRGVASAFDERAQISDIHGALLSL